MTTSKKNWALRTAGIMLVLVLATSCFVGGTFAKYVTSGNGADSARVAKFGVEVTGDPTLFSTQYEKHDNTFIAEANTVVSSNTDKLVAPGTNGDMAEFTVTGTPEVAVRVAYTVNNFKLENWYTDDAGNDEYCPLVFTVNTKEYKIGGTDLDGAAITTIAELETAVTKAIEATTNDYPANTSLSAAGNNLNVSWKWDFSTSADNDVKDTALGDKAAKDVANAGSVALGVAVTVTQID